jgi:hypothetical protein
MDKKVELEVKEESVVKVDPVTGQYYWPSIKGE